jgi:hypothetical protein
MELVLAYLPENQISANYRLINNFQTINIDGMIAFTKGIHATYSILKVGFKP